VAEQSNDLYVIPAKFRKIENLHILFWLVKDLCWCLILKPLGIAMIFPTLSVAIWIAWRNRHIMAELTHNVAITLWIVANSIWMISEFYNVDEKVRPYCIIPFSLGILILAYYYLIYAPLQKKKTKAVTTTVPEPVPVEEVS
jgi:thiol:disulfide interchange protein